jgi:BioD-like phosphotransacetylase family protein
MKKQAVFIGATGQNVGKTTICLGILSGLHKRFGQVGFIKPVGQQHVRVSDTLNVDKDVILFKEYFGLKSSYESMSPVLCPQGFTKDFLDKKVTEAHLIEKISSSFHEIKQTHPYVLVEGTGHTGVGSIFNLNNAKVAQKLGLDMVLLANGGLGSAFDDLTLHIELCRSHGINVRGVILNRVLDEKREMIQTYFPKALKRYNIPILGLIPFLPYLSLPVVSDFETCFQVPLLAGHGHRYRHFQDIKLVAGSLESYLQESRPNQLVITPACRQDIISAVIERELQSKAFGGGLLLTGQMPPTQNVIEQLAKSHIPTLYAPLCSFDAMKIIASYNAKICKEDTAKVKQAIDLVERHIDFDLLCHS